MGEILVDIGKCPLNFLIVTAFRDNVAFSGNRYTIDKNQKLHHQSIAHSIGTET